MKVLLSFNRDLAGNYCVVIKKQSFATSNYDQSRVYPAVATGYKFFVDVPYYFSFGYNGAESVHVVSDFIPEPFSNDVTKKLQKSGLTLDVGASTTIIDIMDLESVIRLLIEAYVESEPQKIVLYSESSLPSCVTNMKACFGSYYVTFKESDRLSYAGYGVNVAIDHLLRLLSEKDEDALFNKVTTYFNPTRTPVDKFSHSEAAVIISHLLHRIEELANGDQFFSLRCAIIDYYTLSCVFPITSSLTLPTLSVRVDCDDIVEELDLNSQKIYFRVDDDYDLYSADGSLLKADNPALITTVAIGTASTYIITKTTREKFVIQSGEVNDFVVTKYICRFDHVLCCDGNKVAKNATYIATKVDPTAIVECGSDTFSIAKISASSTSHVALCTPTCYICSENHIIHYPDGTSESVGPVLEETLISPDCWIELFGVQVKPVMGAVTDVVLAVAGRTEE